MENDPTTEDPTSSIYRRRAEAASIFRPSAPVNKQEMFVGRKSQIEVSMDSVIEAGRHVAIFGERGVGKTSLANILAEILEGTVLVSRVGANRDDDLESLLYRALSDIQVSTSEDCVGFAESQRESSESLAAILGTTEARVSYDTVLRFLRDHGNCVLILDEFDRMRESERARFTDLVKAVSDAGSRATLVFVGVGESVTSLLDEHLSLGRNLAQVEMPRMNREELAAILKKAEGIGIFFPDDIIDEVVRFAQGLPHYAHLLGLRSAYECIEHHGSVVTTDMLDAAVRGALNETGASIRKAYTDATSSAHRDALYPHVLLACALAVHESDDSFGEFRPSHVLAPFRRITKDETKEISTFNGHLTAFAEDVERGKILKRLGKERNYRFRFVDPMLPPYVLMMAHESGLLPGDYFTK